MTNPDRKARPAADAQIIAALVAGASQEEAANRAGVSPSTVFRRLQQPDFIDELEAAKRRLVEQAINQASQGALAGFVVLRKIALDAAVPAQTRTAAARALAQLGVRVLGIDQPQRVEHSGQVELTRESAEERRLRIFAETADRFAKMTPDELAAEAAGLEQP